MVGFSALQDMTKVLFLCFFYSALYPAAFFFCAAILLAQYYTDKYCLMVSARGRLPDDAVCIISS
jgi:hypothetical protein